MPHRFGRVITPVHAQVGDSHLAHLGSAVLVRTRSRFWLLSAAHVLKQQVNLWLGGKPQSFPLRGNLVWFGDPLDLAFTELSAANSEALINNGNSFLPIARVDARTRDFSNFRMIAHGFPARGIEIDGDSREITATPTTLRSKFLSNVDLRKSNCDPALEVAGLYDILVDSNGQPVKKLEIRGLSGGAIWSRSEDDKLHLVGIVKEFDPKRKLVIGTRIRPLLVEMERRLAAADVEPSSPGV
ncbi:MAG TPA: hypothetical protein VGM73_00820 [Candidatus Didemnitutus sp.]|jgi:hypothetical protein